MGIDGFQIIPAVELLKMEKNIGSKSVFEDENSRAHIYELQNGEYILFPVSCNKGLLIKERKTLDYILATKIPIEHGHRVPHIEKQNLILHLPGSASLAIESINRELNTSIDLGNLEFDVEELNKKVRKYGCLRAYEELSIELGILFCEVLRKKEEGLSYKLEKRYDINPYYEAHLLDKTGATIDPWYYLNRYLIEKKKFNFNEIYEKTEHFRI